MGWVGLGWVGMNGNGDEWKEGRTQFGRIEVNDDGATNHTDWWLLTWDITYMAYDRIRDRTGVQVSSLCLHPCHF